MGTCTYIDRELGVLVIVDLQTVTGSDVLPKLDVNSVWSRTPTCRSRPIRTFT